MKSRIVYLRTSTEEQNTENQLKDTVSLVPDGEEYTLLEEQQSAFKDVGRKKFEAVIAHIKKRKCSDLYCWDFDRLFRDRQKLVDFFRVCKAYSCKVHSFRQAWLEDVNKAPSPWNEILNDLLLQILGWIAEDESRKKSDRIKNAVRVREGLAYSYKGNKWGRKPISTRKRNKILALRSEGLSIRRIAEEVGVSVGVVHKSLAGLSSGNKLK